MEGECILNKKDILLDAFIKENNLSKINGEQNKDTELTELFERLYKKKRSIIFLTHSSITKEDVSLFNNYFNELINEVKEYKNLSDKYSFIRKVKDDVNLEYNELKKLCSDMYL